MQLFFLLRAFTIRYPFLHPREKLLKKLPDLPENFGPFFTNNGTKYVSYPSGKDYIIKNLFWFGEFEPWVTTMINRLIKPNEIFCDIGANIGDTSLQLLPHLSSYAHIYCFEPVPLLQNCINENLSANNVSGVTIVQKALSNSNGIMKMKVFNDQPGGSKITKKDDTVTEDQIIEVEVITFDFWLEDNKDVSDIAVCKIDVECHEPEVLEGMKNSLSNGRIGSIIFERHLLNQNSDPVVKLLNDCNYRVFRIYKGFFKILALELSNKRFLMRGTSDYIAVLKGSVFEQRLNKFIDKK